MRCAYWRDLWADVDWLWEERAEEGREEVEEVVWRVVLVVVDVVGGAAWCGLWLEFGFDGRVVREVEAEMDACSRRLLEEEVEVAMLVMFGIDRFGREKRRSQGRQVT